MATIDLKDAYHVVPIAESSRKYLRFTFNGDKYEFSCLPFGLNTVPYVFTKIMKPVVAHLRKLGHISVVYLDDILLIGNSVDDCQRNVDITLCLLQELWFVINREKSRLQRSRQCKFLGFYLDTEIMLIELPENKRMSIQAAIERFSTQHSCKIRDFASFLGSLGDCCKAAKYGWVYTKDLEREKMFALRDDNEDYEASMTLSRNVQKDLAWGQAKIFTINNPIRGLKYRIEIFSDASLTGWEISCKNEKSHGHWNVTDRKNHINYLELLSTFFGLKCFTSDLRNCEILLRIDDTTAISYINRMGGIQIRKLSKLAKDIWKWCEQRNLWIFASYIRSEDNNRVRVKKA